MINFIPEKLLSFTTMIALDEQNNLLYASDSAKELLGVDYKLEVGAPFGAVDKSINSKIILELAHLASHDNYRYVREVTRGNKIYTISASPLKIKDKNCAVVSFEDNTELRQKDKENTLLYHITSTMSSDLPVKEITEKILYQVINIMGLQGGDIMLIDHVKGTLYVENTTDTTTTQKVNLGEGVSGFVASTGQPLSTTHVVDEKRYILGKDEQDKSLLAVPVMAKGQIYGVLNLWKPAGEYFTESEVQTYSVIAANIADVLDAKQLRTIAEKRLELAKILDSTLEIEPMLDQAILKTAEILDHAQCSIYLWRSDKLLEWSSSSHHKSTEFRGQYLPLVRQEVLETFQKNQNTIINLAESTNLNWVRELVNRRGWKDVTVSGLISKGQLYGLLFLHNAIQNTKNDEYINLIRALSSQLSMAIENAKLYDQSKREVEILDSIQMTTEQGIILLNNEKKIIYTNRAVDQILKLKKPIGGLDIGKFANNFQKYSKYNINRSRSVITIIKKNIENDFSTDIEIVDKKSKKNLCLTLRVLNQNTLHKNYLITIDDISKLKNLQNQISDRLQQTTQLFKISSFKVKEAKQALLRIVDNLPQLLQAEESLILIVNDQNHLELLNPKNANHLKWRQFVQYLPKIGEIHNLAKKSTKRPYVYPNNYSESIKELLPQGLRNFIIFPLVASGKVKGAILVANKHSEKNFSSQDLRLLSIIARQITSILENNELLQEIELEKNRLSAIIRHSADGMILVDQEQQIISWNKAMEKLTGFNSKQAIAKNVDELIRLPHGNSFINLLYKHAGNKLHSSIPELEILDKNNDSHWFDVHFAKPLESETSKFGELVILFNDVSKYKELDQQKNEFISVTAHELRTPLTAIKGYLSMIIEGDAGPLNEKQEKYFSRTYQSTERLVNLVEDLLNFLRLEEHRVIYNLQSTDLTKITKEVISDLFQKASKKDIHLNLDNGHPSGEKILADPGRTKQILANLIDNAIKYTPKGGKVNVRIHKEQYGKKNYLITEVEDNGVGITNENILNIFDKFQRVNNPMSTQAGGYGLGLFITRSLVEQQGGEIWVKSQPGKGSIFSFSLPLVNNKNRTNKTAVPKKKG